MNHLDFVIWIIGWAWMMGQATVCICESPREKLTDGEGYIITALFIIWIAVAILIY